MRIVFREKHPAFVLFDFDTDGMPRTVEAKIKNGFWNALCGVMPELSKAAHLVRHSTSARALPRRDEQEVRGWRRASCLCRDPGWGRRQALRRHAARPSMVRWPGLDQVQFLRLAAGALIVDRSVAAPERLVFEADPVLRKPLKQDAESREPIIFDGVIPTRRKPFRRSPRKNNKRSIG